MFSATFPRQMEALARKILTKPIEVRFFHPTSARALKIPFADVRILLKWEPIVTNRDLLSFIISLSTRAVIGQVSGPYSPVRPAKI